MSAVTVLTIPLQITTLLVAAAAIVTMLRRASAAVHHLVWMIGLTGASLVPLVGALLPEWGVMDFTVDQGMLGLANATALPAVREGVALSSVLASLWLAGAVIMLCRVVAGELRLARRIQRRSRDIDSDWQRAIDTVSPEGNEVRFVGCDWLDTPCAWGVVRPVVLLPSQFVTWSDADRRRAVLHELAHIERGDLVANLVARVATALFWWHPLVWMAAGAARLARERACDDAVLRRDPEAADYAALLLTLGAVAHRNDGILSPALGLADESALGSRIRGVLDTSRNRAVVAGRTRATAIAVGVALVVVVASIAPAQQSVTVARDSVERAKAMRLISTTACARTQGGTARQTFTGRMRNAAGKVEEFTITVRCDAKESGRKG